MDKKTEAEQAENVPLKKKITHTFKEWCMSSTSHGIPNIARNENFFIRTMWLICFLASSGYCGYSIYVSIIDFLDYGTNTKIETVYAYPMEFPAVTVCNNNMFTTKAGLDFAQQILAQNGIPDPAKSPLLSFITNYPRMQESVNVYFAYNVVSNNAKGLNDTMKQTLGMSKENFVIGMTFNNQPLGLDNLRWYFHYNFGNCFQFNTGYNASGGSVEVLSTSKPGLLNGLRMFLFVGTNNSVNSLAFFNGARVFIHNRTQEPTVTDGISATAGSHVEYTITRTTQAWLEKPYNECYDDLTSPDKFDSFFYKKTLENSDTYRQSDCLDICTQDYIIKSCGCADPAYPNLYNTRFCTSIFDTICAFVNRTALYTTNKDYFNTFFGYCPLQCASTTFGITTSSTDFPTDYYAQILVDNSNVVSNLAGLGKSVTAENLKKNFVWVNVYYDRNVYMAISETPKALITDLMSNIGGTMGLYIGISFLSFVEFLEIGMQLFLLIIKHSSKASRVSNQSDQMQAWQN